MRTVDKTQLLREWEFKIHADYRALGQILTYIALARRERDFARVVRGVIAAFDFQPEVRLAIEVLNLGIELVILPPWMAAAGGIPSSERADQTAPAIPYRPLQMPMEDE
jgi:hypothetical protein